MFALSELLDLLFPPSTKKKRVSDATLEEVLFLLQPTVISEGVALLPYKHPLVRALVTEAKFQGNQKAQQLLADVLSDVLPDWISEENGLDARPVALVPVPLSKKRFRERGYNQVTEILKRVRVPGAELLPRVLSRTRDTRAQTSLGRSARLQNLLSAFTATPLNPAYLYIVIDDVHTTGATLTEAVRALKAEGAVEVRTLAIAY